MDSLEVLAFFCDHYNLDVWAIITSYKISYDEQLTHLNPNDQIISNVIVMLSHRGLLPIDSNILNMKYRQMLFVDGDTHWSIKTNHGEIYYVNVWCMWFSNRFNYLRDIMRYNELNPPRKRIYVTDDNKFALDLKTLEMLRKNSIECFTIRELANSVYLASSKSAPTYKVINEKQINTNADVFIPDSVIKYYNFPKGAIIQVTQPDTNEVSHQIIT
jgi:hypothetical protein